MSQMAEHFHLFKLKFKQIKREIVFKIFDIISPQTKSQLFSQNVYLQRTNKTTLLTFQTFNKKKIIFMKIRSIL